MSPTVHVTGYKLYAVIINLPAEQATFTYAVAPLEESLSLI